MSVYIIYACSVVPGVTCEYVNTFCFMPSASGHYLALRNSTNFNNDCPHAMVGIIDEKASPYAIALNAIEDAKYMCTRTHGDAPEVEMRGRLDLTLPQIPDHIHYILVGRLNFCFYTAISVCISSRV